MMKKLPYLPTYAKVEEASAYLEAATGEAWPLARILDAGASAFVLIAPPEGTPQAVIDAVLGGRTGGFYGPLLLSGDIQRLTHSPGDAAMHMTQTPEGRVINFDPPARFTSDEVRMHAADVERIAEMFPVHECKRSQQPEVLHLDGFDVTIADGHSLRQALHLHGGIARIELVEQPSAVEPPAPEQAEAAPADTGRTTRARLHPLDGVISQARERARSNHWQTIWSELCRMAESSDRPAPLKGYVPNEGLKIHSEDPEGFKYYGRDAFRQLMGRRNRGNGDH
ncbi:MAG: hypothetical protein RL654_634 [Pseudomonadota bacterium]